MAALMVMLICMIFGVLHGPNVEASVSVMSYGAKGDGITDDSQAFLKGLGDICTGKGGTSTLVIPSGYTFLLQPINFEGPCKSSSITIQILGNIVAPAMKNFKSGTDKWLYFENVNQLTISGTGQFDGKGSDWWDCENHIVKNKPNPCESNPTALAFHGCNGLRLDGFKSTNSQRNHLSINKCNNAIISNVHISAPGTSPNTDGIDISSSTNVQVVNSNIGTGDDCIAINAGCSSINITGVFCGPGHGISIGSLGRNGATESVSDIHVKNCTFSKTDNGARIKTVPGGSGYAKNIIFEDITLDATSNPIIINQFYCPHATCKDQKPVVSVAGVSYIRVHGTATTSKPVINLNCSSFSGCTGIVLNNVNIAAVDSKKPATAFCRNAGVSTTSTTPAVSCVKSSVITMPLDYDNVNSFADLDATF